MFFVSVLRVLGVCIILLAAAAPAWAEKGLLLKQFSARYGSVTCMVCANSFRMDAAELRVFLKPPFKQVNLYNMASKTSLTCVVDTLGKDVDWHELKPREVKLHGHEEIVCKGEDRLQNYKLTRYLINHVFPASPTTPSLDFWTTKEKDFPQVLNEACCKLTGLPVGYGFPLKMYQYLEKHRPDGRQFFLHYRVLDTTKVTEQDFPATTFAQPQGFHPAADLMELMMGSADP